MSAILIVACHAWSFGQPVPYTSSLPRQILEPCELIVGSGKPVLSTSSATASVGETIVVDCRVQLFKQSSALFNPFLDPRYLLPAEVVMVSSDGSITHQLLVADSTQAEPPDYFSWVGPKLVRTIGRKITVRLVDPSAPPIVSADEVAVPAKLGEYYIQARYNAWLFAQWNREFDDDSPLPISDSPQALRGYTEQQMRLPNGISSPVKLSIVPPKDHLKSGPAGSSNSFTIELVLPMETVGIGEQVATVLELENTSNQHIEVFKPYYENALGRFNDAIVLSLSSADGTRVGNLWQQASLSQAVPICSHWIRFPPKGVASTVFHFTAGRHYDSDKGKFQTWPPGTYQIRAELMGHFLSGIPSGLGQAVFGMPNTISCGNALELAGTKRRIPYREWEATFPGPQVYRSSAVEFLVTPGNR